MISASTTETTTSAISRTTTSSLCQRRESFSGKLDLSRYLPIVGRLDLIVKVRSRYYAKPSGACLGFMQDPSFNRHNINNQYMFFDFCIEDQLCTTSYLLHHLTIYLFILGNHILFHCRLPLGLIIALLSIYL